MAREFHNSRPEDDGDGFTFTYEVSAGRWPKVTLYGDDGEVTAFGLGEIRALAEASARALLLAEEAGETEKKEAA